MSLEASITGVLPVVHTPFTAEGDIDFDALGQELTWVMDQDVDGLTTGMVSEILRLSGEERRLLTEHVCAAASKRDRTSVISVGAESLNVALGHAIHAESHGATALMAVPPVTVALEDEALYGYFSGIITATSIPLIVQDASGYVGHSLSLPLQVRLFEEFGDRVLFKPESPPVGQRLSKLLADTGGRARVLEGAGGAAIVDSYRRGIVGTIPGSEVCWAIRRLWDAVTVGDWDTAYAISGPLNLLTAMQTTVDGYVAIEKYLLVRQGILTDDYHRTPRSFVIDPDTAAEVDRLLNRIALAAGQPERVC